MNTKIIEVLRQALSALANCHHSLYIGHTAGIEARTAIDNLRPLITELEAGSTAPAVPDRCRLIRSPITEEMHVAAVKVLLRAHGMDGLPQRMLDAMLASAPAVPDDFEADAKRLALELECLIMSCKDTAAVSKWWDSAHEALEQHRAILAAVERSAEGTCYYPKNGVPQPTAPAVRCEYCDGTGDVHRADGEWLGICCCEAAPQHAEKKGE